MSQSAEQAAEELESALKFGRCPMCEGIQCEGLEWLVNTTRQKIRECSFQNIVELITDGQHNLW
jgi:hypothetical protein